MSLARSWFLIALGVCAGVVACGGSSGTGTGPTQIADAPSIACPIAPAPVVSPNGSAQPVSFGSPTVTGGQAPLTTSCLPASGASFTVGTTTVTCTTTDARSRAASCTFPVVVQPPPKLSVTSFLAFGDSITWGEDGAAAASASASGQHVYVQLVGRTYPDDLQSALRARYAQQQVSVTNAGCPGESLSDPGTIGDKSTCLGARSDDPSAFRRFTSLAATHQWGAVLLMEGSNDVNTAAGDSTVLPTAASYLRQMVDAARANGMRVIVATVPPMAPPGVPSRTKGSAIVPTYDDMVRAVATSENIPLADVYAAFGSDAPTLIGFDGLHPNPSGYQRIADTFLGAIEKSLEAQQTVSRRP
jgi:lysophospholipase L1-like esterase